MTQIENSLDALTKFVVDNRRTGFTFEEIAEKRGIKVLDVVNAWKEYVQNRATMPEEEWQVLHEIRLEHFLTQCNERLTYATRADDYELILKTLDRIEAMQVINKERKSDAEAKLNQLTQQQTQLILTAMMNMRNEFKGFLEKAFEQKTIKSIRGTVLDSFDTAFNEVATKALTKAGEES